MGKKRARAVRSQKQGGAHATRTKAEFVALVRRQHKQLEALKGKLHAQDKRKGASVRGRPSALKGALVADTSDQPDVHTNFVATGPATIGFRAGSFGTDFTVGVYGAGSSDRSDDDTRPIGVLGRSTTLDGADGAGTGVVGMSGAGTGVHGVSERGNGVYGSGGSYGVFGSGELGVYGTGGNGIVGHGSYIPDDWGPGFGYGGWFSGGAAPIHLEPSLYASPPSSGLAGDLFVDNSGALWFCTRGGNAATWRKVQLV